MKLNDIPRLKIACLPTPLQHMSNFTNYLNGPNVFIKRDDLTGLAFGGSKVRALEYILGNVKKDEVDTIVTVGSTYDNWSTQVVAVSRKLGMKTIIISFKQISPHSRLVYDHNFLLKKLMDTEMKVISSREIGIKSKDEIINNFCEKLRNKGYKPHFVSHNNPHYVIGIAIMIQELMCQTEKKGINIDYIVHASDGGATQAGLILGTQIFNDRIKVLGLSVRNKRSYATKKIAEIVNKHAHLFGIKSFTDPNLINVMDDYIGKGYGVVDKEIVAAIRFVAKKEGIFLEPVYNGKAINGLINLIKKNHFKKKSNIVFIHTGGTPMLFGYREPITNILKGKKLLWEKPRWILKDKTD